MKNSTSLFWINFRIYKTAVSMFIVLRQFKKEVFQILVFKLDLIIQFILE